MPKYKCTNKECKQFDTEVMVEKSISKIIDGKFIDYGSICPVCKHTMEFIRPSEGFTTFMRGSDNICKR